MIKLLKYLKPYWWIIAIVIAFLALQSYAQLLLPDAMGNITSIIGALDTTTRETYDVLRAFPNGWQVPFIEPTGNYLTDIWVIGSYMLIISFVVFASAILCSNLIASVGAKFAKKVRLDVFTKIENFSFADLNKFGGASLITRTTNDVQQVQLTFMQVLRTMVFSPIIIITALILIFQRDARLALVVAIAVPVVLIVILITFRFATPLFSKMQYAIDAYTKVIREGISGVRVIRAFNQEASEMKRFDEKNAEVTKINMKVSRIMSVATPTMSIMFNVTYIVIYFFGFSLLNGESLANPETAAFMTDVITAAQYSMQIMMAFLFLSITLIMIPRSFACARRINEVLSIDPLIKDPVSPVNTETKTRGVVEFNNVTFTFPDASTPTLTNINFKTSPGTTTALIGSTGSGKSTIIQLIPRFYDVVEGEVLVNGIDIREYKQSTLREKIGFVPQHALLFSGTVRENLKFANENATDEELMTAAEISFSKSFLERKEGLDTRVSQKGKNFSGGQKQRLCIARALVNKPEIYIFDDSFSALDFKTDVKVRAALKDYTKDASVIIVAQRVSTIMDADNIIVLDNGRIVDQGKHGELLLRCSVYQEIVYSQLDKNEIEKTIALSKAALTEKGDE